MKAGHALTELGFKIQREHFGEFRGHGRASVWKRRSDHRQKTLYRFHDDVGNEKRFLVRKLRFFCPKGLHERLPQNFSGRGATGKFDGGIAEDEKGWPSLREFPRPVDQRLSELGGG